jgi:predicted nucleic acid-binding protein
MAASPELQRLRRALEVAGRFVALPYDELVAEHLADARCRPQQATTGAMEAIIATALVHDLDIWTQDDDFDVPGDLAPEIRIPRA